MTFTRPADNSVQIYTAKAIDLTGTITAEDDVTNHDDFYEGLLQSSFYWLAGQGGYGIQTSPGISKIIECLITGTKWPDYLSDNSITPETLSPKRKI